VSGIGLAAYYARIGFRGRGVPTLATLREIHGLHAAAIPFENLAAFLGEPIELDVEALEEKLVRRERGGWCFEHNLLFCHVLRAIGFEVTPLAARVRWNVPAPVVTPRSHCLLLVRLPEGDHIADVGFGGLSLTAPLRLEPGLEQATPHEPFRLSLAQGRYMLEAKLGGDFQPLYLFDLQEQMQADYEVSNWYLAHHPRSQFVTGLVAARAAPDRRHALRNTRYSVHFPDGRTEKREVENVAQLRDILAGELHVRVPPGNAVDARLEEMIRRNR
jgi:N-hydroxyarylamine O-acetyltransferase